MITGITWKLEGEVQFAFFVQIIDITCVLGGSGLVDNIDHNQWITFKSSMLSEYA